MELLEDQVCPHCGYVVEDHQSNWGADTEIIECYSCRKKYTSNAVYKFLGFEVQKYCETCEESEDECYCDIETDESAKAV